MHVAFHALTLLEQLSEELPRLEANVFHLAYLPICWPAEDDGRHTLVARTGSKRWAVKGQKTALWN